jgi:hypothetical protein
VYIRAYGITGNLIDWFSSYLKGRRQKVAIKNNSSAYCEISAGIPQSSVLGPLLSQNKKQFASLFSNEFKMLVKNPVINHERGKDREVLMTSGTYPWSFVTQICHNGPQCHGDDHKTGE